MKKRKDVTVSRLRRYFITASVDQRAKTAAIMYTVLMCMAFAVPAFIRDNASHDISPYVLLAIIVPITVMGGSFFYRLIGRPLRAIEERQAEVIGRRLTGDEKVQLYVWYKHGMKPTDTALQPVLPKYLGYLESRLNGTYRDSYTTSKRYRRLALLSAVLLLAGSVTQLFDTDRNLANIGFGLIGGMFFLIAGLRKPTAEPRRLASTLNGRRLRTIARMRAQLQ